LNAVSGFCACVIKINPFQIKIFGVMYDEATFKLNEIVNQQTESTGPRKIHM